MESGKDEILSTFQECTGIEDIEEAIGLLESCNWDLMTALKNHQSVEHKEIVNIHRQLNAPSTSFPSFYQPHMFEQAEVIEIDPAPEDSPTSLTNLSSAASFTATFNSPQPSTSSVPSSQNSIMKLSIMVLCAGGSENGSFPLEVPGSTSVGELKTMLYQLIGVPVCHQVLEGFTKPVDDHTVIVPDLLPKNMTLSLSSNAPSSLYERLNGAQGDFHLLIHDEITKKDHSLHFPASKIIRELKLDIYHLTNIPVRYQQWTGWPPNLDDNAALETVGISKEHHLTVGKQLPPTPKTNKKVIVDAVGDDSSADDEFEDASDLLPDDYLDIVDVPSSQRQQSLIHPNTEDDLTGVNQFCEQFHQRYGNCIPTFHQGTLESALKDSVYLPAKRRKLLAVYLHHDGSVFANVFCSESLCQLSVVDYLNANFVIWGWDLSHESNKTRLLNLVSQHFGSVASSTVRSFGLDKLPAILLITKSRGSTEVLSVIHGNCALDEVMTSLLHAMEMFEDQRRPEVLEEEAREQREAIKAEQDAAYHASLEADQAKARAKRVAEIQKKVERERQQSIRQQEEAIKTAVRASLEVDLPPEPHPDCSDPTTKLRFRVCNKDTFTRTFTLSTPLQDVLNYLCVKGYAADEYKYIQSWPRRDITKLDTSSTLEELKFPPQETLTIEER